MKLFHFSLLHYFKGEREDQYNKLVNQDTRQKESFFGNWFFRGLIDDIL